MSRPWGKRENRRIASLWWALVALVSAVGLPAAQGQVADDYDLTVIVFAPDAGPAQIALSYSTLIDRSTLLQGLDALAQAAGVSIGQVEVEDGQQARGDPEKATAAQLTAHGLVRPQTGTLPVGPIIRSLPDWRRMRLVFIVGEHFTFVGPSGASAEGFAVRLVNRMKPYEYDVERKSGGVATPEAAGAEKPVSRALLPAVLIGLPAGFLVGWLLGDVTPGRPRTEKANDSGWGPGRFHTPGPRGG
ncbi:MAG: hypothetical protein MUQ65_07430 [Armatimonadetes bacterium]|nr:hypothetical protein [Armatimonadota bacterium]